MRKASYEFAKKRSDLFRPEIPVKLVNPKTGKYCYVSAVIDTGADDCVLPQMVAQQIGLSMKRGEEDKKGAMGISGVSVPAWRHIINLEVYDYKRVKKLRSMNVIVACL